MNTKFRHHARHLYTWKSPGDRARNQIDFITVNKRFSNSITQVRTYPGADCGAGCDHVPVVAEMKVKLKKIKKKRRIRKDWNQLRTDSRVRETYTREAIRRFEAHTHTGVGPEDINHDWRRLQESMVGAAEEIVPRERQERRQPWMTQDILDLMEERRQFKNVPGNRYKELDRIIKFQCKEKREEWLQAKCLEIEGLENTNQRIMAEKIRELTGGKKFQKCFEV